VIGLANEGGDRLSPSRTEQKTRLLWSGAVIEISNLSGEIHRSRNCISFGIKPEAVESPI
jgi:hypothetical protein